MSLAIFFPVINKHTIIFPSKVITSYLAIHMLRLTKYKRSGTSVSTPLVVKKYTQCTHNVHTYNIQSFYKSHIYNATTNGRVFDTKM